jgi:hypothetical protein
MRRASTSKAWPAANPTNRCTGRTGYACAHARGGSIGNAAELVTNCRNVRRGTFMLIPALSYVAHKYVAHKTDRAVRRKNSLHARGHSTTLFAAHGDEETVR